MKRRTLVCTAVLAAFFAVAGDLARAQTPEPAVYAAPLRLKTEATVGASVVRLGDLFEGLGEEASTAVAGAPAPGDRVTLNAQWLYALARSYALPWRPRSNLDSVVVERASRVIDGPRIEDLLMSAFAERGLDGELSLRFDDPQIRLHLPVDAAPTLALAGLTLDPGSGRFTAQLTAPAGEAPLVRVAVSGRVLRMIQVPVPAHRLASDSVIGPDDIAWVSLRADRIGRNVITDAGSLIGKSPRRTLQAGRVIRVNDVRRPVVVAKNGLVAIRLETSRMVLTVQGRALDNGSTNDTIRVMNTQSNRTINAVVVSSNLVVVPQFASE